MLAVRNRVRDDVSKYNYALGGNPSDVITCDKKITHTMHKARISSQPLPDSFSYSSFKSNNLQ